MGGDEERARGVEASGVVSAMDRWRGRVRERQGPRLRGVGKTEGRVGNKTGGNVKDGVKRRKGERSYMLRMRGQVGAEKPSEGLAGQGERRGIARNGNWPETAVQLPCNYILFLILLI